MGKLLIIDDDNVFTDYVAGVASKEGWSTKACNDSRFAMDFACRFKPDLIISDIIMPPPDGLEVLQKLGEAIPAADVVIVTSFDPIYLQMATRLLRDKFDRPPRSALKPLEPGVIRELLSGASPSPGGL